MGVSGTVALALSLTAGPSTPPPLNVVANLVFVERSWTGTSTLYLSACNQTSGTVQLRAIGDGHFPRGSNPSVPAEQCLSSLFYTRGPTAVVELRQGMLIKSIDLTIPSGKSWGDEPWAYILFGVLGFLASSLGDSVKTILVHPFRILRLEMLVRASRTGLISNLDSVSRTFTIPAELDGIRNGDMSSFVWVPPSTLRRCSNLASAYDIWKRNPRMSDEDRQLLQRLLGIR
jgi:hypothetical protein